MVRVPVLVGSLVGVPLGVLLVGAAVGRPARQQARRGPPPVLPAVTTELVQVDAVVTDKQDRQVTDLTAEDFEITEDGKRRPITHFRYVAREPTPVAAPTGPPAATSQPTPSREATKRALAIVFDDLSLSFEGQVWARKELHRLVAERIGAGDLVSVTRTGGGIGNLQQFTGDRRLLDAAIDGVRFNLAGRGELKATMLPALSLTGARTESQGEAPERSELNERAERARQVHVALGTLAAIELVVQALERMPGRKALVLVSEGFAMKDDSGDDGPVRARMGRMLDAAHRAAVVIRAAR